ncbi:MAG: hypothetical protein KKE20_06305 [Nanoarchaeota archaeon]|nr:hypothetical protein [Nanoarchaeota archaeon]
MGDEQISENVKEEKKTSEVAITYETLFELLRREKNRDELQKLEESFFDDVIKYVEGKKNILSTQQGELLATDEREKTLIQLQNIKKIIRELYDRREKKIINLAINKARTKSNIIDTSSLICEERTLFDALCKTLHLFREDILNNIIEARKPLLTQENIPDQIRDPLNSSESLPEPEKGQALNTSSKEPETRVEKILVSIRFLSPVPQFVGSELELYGPYEEDEIADLPEDVAKVLIEKGRAEKD